LRLQRRISHALGDRRGNVAVTLALILPVLLTVVGGAVDFTFAIAARTSLQDAADAASVGAIATSSTAYRVASAMIVDGAVPAGVADATAIFNADTAALAGANNIQMTSTVMKSGQTITSTVTASAAYKPALLGLIGISTMPFSVTSTSVNSTPRYVDFYLLLDVSGSMGLPSTNGGETTLAAVNPDNRNLYPGGCVFACHFAGYQGYTLSRGATQVKSCPTPDTPTCIQLRLDAVGSAVNQLIQTANSSQKVANQYRIGLYPFIANLYPYFPLTAAISGSASTPLTINYAAANLATVLDTGADPVMGSGGTHFENALPQMSAAIPGGATVGTGASPTSTQPFVFFVTDGSQNNQLQAGGAWWGSNSATTLDASLCTPLKTRGIKIAVLYIPYQPIQNPTTFANSEDFYANANIPNIPAKLQACATPGFYFSANTPQDITNAMTAMFQQAVNYDRIAH